MSRRERRRLKDSNKELEKTKVTGEVESKDERTSRDNEKTGRTRKRKVTEKVYDMIKPELLARVDEIIASERGMKYFIKTEGWQHLSEHYIHAADVPKFRDELERCLNDECYIDLDRTDIKYSRIVDICKY